MRVLFIEDDENSILAAKIKLGGEGHQIEVSDFNEIPTKVKRFQPDVVVLDMMNGGATGDPTGDSGKHTFQQIWDTRFCPIVIYSADPDLLEELEAGIFRHPFIGKVTKGKNSEDLLHTELSTYLPCIEGINAIKEDLNIILQQTIRDVAPVIFAQEAKLGISTSTAIQHMGRRRVSAHLDTSTLIREKLAPWEQYIYPPLDNSLKLGDIIRETAGEVGDPTSYLINLTPSCDLVKSDHRAPNVKQALCARCEPIDFTKIQVSKKVGKLQPHLSQGFVKEYLPLPSFPGIVPAMVANLKKLELLDCDQISKKEGEGVRFLRVASVDSPFREQISWAYLSTGCRPGVPDRDFVSWEQQYLD